jgi:hypothetical protein
MDFFWATRHSISEDSGIHIDPQVQQDLITKWFKPTFVRNISCRVFIVHVQHYMFRLHMSHLQVCHV